MQKEHFLRQLRSLSPILEPAHDGSAMWALWVVALIFGALGFGLSGFGAVLWGAELSEPWGDVPQTLFIWVGVAPFVLLTLLGGILILGGPSNMEEGVQYSDAAFIVFFAYCFDWMVYRWRRR